MSGDSAVSKDEHIHECGIEGRHATCACCICGALFPNHEYSGPVAINDSQASLAERVKTLTEALDWALGVIWEEFHVSEQRVAHGLDERYKQAEALLKESKEAGNGGK